tara:strand:- start:614 stop:1009 length:396 start_codon:yes stop_codon:yes gene_type:complete
MKLNNDEKLQLAGIAAIVPVLIASTHAKTHEKRNTYSSDDFDDIMIPILGTSQFIAFAFYCYNSGLKNPLNIRSNGKSGIPFSIMLGFFSQGNNMLAAIPVNRRKWHHRFYGSMVLYGCYLAGMRKQKKID